MAHAIPKSCFGRTLCVIVVAVAYMSGCGGVAVYQRGKLSHFSMKPSDGTSVGQDHVFAIHEGAIGGSVGTASGCGCN